VFDVLSLVTMGRGTGKGESELYAPFLAVPANDAQLKIIQYLAEHRAELDREYMHSDDAPRDKMLFERNWRDFKDHLIEQKIMHAKVEVNGKTIELQVSGIRAALRNFKASWARIREKVHRVLIQMNLFMLIAQFCG
jgi:hypothetical protein